jgi:hypothetical protein
LFEFTFKRRRWLSFWGILSGAVFQAVLMLLEIWLS